MIGSHLRRRRWLLLAIAVAGGLLFLANPWRTRIPQPPDPSSDALEPAVARAVRDARGKVLERPRSAETWGELGEVLLANEIESDALTCFVQAAARDPGDGRWPYLQAVVLINRGDRDASLPYLRQASELGVGNDSMTPRLVLVEQLLLLGRIGEVEPILQWCLARAAGEARVQFDAGLLAIARQDFNEARNRFEKCSSSPYCRKKTRIQLSNVSLRLGGSDRAAALQQEAEQLPTDAEWPDPAVTRYMKRAVKKRSALHAVESLEAQGRHAEALKLLAPLADDFPNDDVMHLTVGRLLARTGDLSGGAAAVRRAHALAPHKIQPHYYLSLILLEDGKEAERAGDKERAAKRFSEAAGEAREALKLKPDYGYAHMALGLASKHQGEKRQALASLEEAVRCNPEHGELQFQLAELLLESDRWKEAVFRYERAIAFAPPNASWQPVAEKRLADLRAKPK